MKRNKNNKINKRILALGMSTVLLITLIAGTVGVLASQNGAAGTESTLRAALSDTAPNLISGQSANTTRDEVVYVFTDASGDTDKIIVSDWLRENGGDNYKNSETDKQPPVSMQISYTLDGVKTSPEDMAGKSGKAVIRFDFTNNAYETVKTGDKDENINVPFMMITAMLLDNDVFTNVEVTNGRLVNDGSRQVVVGYALPGLQDALDIDKEKIDIPDYFEISADVKDFALEMTLTLASSEVFTKLDLDHVDSLDELSDALTEMSDAMDQLIDGSGKLYDGLNTLLSESGKLTDGASKLADGAKQLKDGADTLGSGAGSLTDGAKQLSSGLNELNANSSALNNGAEQVFNALLSTASSQIAASGQNVGTLTIGNYADVLTALINSLDEAGIYAQALAKVTAGVDALGDSIYQTYINNNAESIYITYLRSNSDSICRAYIESNADSIYEQYIAGIADSIYAQYIAANADAVYQQYVSSNSGDILNAYVLSQIPDEQKAVMSEEQIAQAVAAGVGGLTEEQKSQILAGALAQLSDEQKAQIREGAAGQLTEEQKAQIRAGALAQLTDEQRSQILEGAITQLSDEQKELIIQGAAAQLTDEQKSQILAGALAGLTDEQKNQIRQGAIDQTMASAEVQAQIAAASESVKQLASLKAQLDTYNQFYLGLKAYTAGVASAATGAGSLASGAVQLQEGTAALSSGAGDLYNGVKELQAGLPDLIDGITQLRDGSKELSDGISRFNEEAVQKLIDTVDEDLEGVIDRIKAVREAANLYSYGGGEAGGDAGTSAKFIYKTAAVK